MARIPEEELERLKREISVQRLAEGRGVNFTRHGADLIGLCPFHDDHEPSLVISPRKNLWHCLGACQAGGSVIDWVMKSEGASFRHAVELLREGLSDAAPVKSTASKTSPPVEVDAEDRQVLARVVNYYHETLKQSPEAIKYLEGRGLMSSEMIERFRMGFSNRTLGYRLPAKSRKAGRQARKQLQRLGILRGSGHEHFNGSVVIPVFDGQGNVCEMYGRKITQNLRKGTPLHLYLPGPHKGIWNEEALKASKEIILCESLIDALTFWCAGYRNVTASYGIEGFNTEHLEAFREYKTERVLIAYDRDEAGNKAALDLADKLSFEGMDCYRVQFPKGMDANEYASKVGPADKSLGVVIRGASWICKSRFPNHGPLGNDMPAAKEPEPAASSEETTTTLAASPVPPAPEAGVAAELEHGEVVIRLGDRRYRIRGMEKNLSYDLMKVNVFASRGDSFHVDTFDLYSARQRGAFVKHAAAELELKENAIKKDLGRVLLKLEQLQAEQIKAALLPKEKKVAIKEADRAAALALLKDPKLLERILADFERCGVVGEETNKLTGYLAAVSRKLPEPLAVIIQSSSAAGKTLLMDAILSFVPEEDRVKYSAMTGQSLFYMGEHDLKHKVLAIVEEEGAERAGYALKLLQSERELTIASTGKDPDTGRLVTHEYRVEGPVMILLTTTAIEIEEELLNRCMVFTVDEEREQTRAIHRIQRQAQTLEGLLSQQDRERLLKVHRDAQRLLRPLLVANPYAKELTFLDDRTRTRRDHVKYLTLIRSIALLHQYQRQVKTVEHGGKEVAYIEVTLDDIETANKLAHQVLGRSLDELAPQARRLLMFLKHMVDGACGRQEMDQDDYRFTRRQVREHTGWSDFQVRTHLEKLVQLEYVLVHHGGRGQQFVYELLYDGQGKNGGQFLMGLIEPGCLSKGCDYDSKFEGSKEEFEHEKPRFESGSSPQRASIEPPLRSPEIFATSGKICTSPALSFASHENALKGPKKPVSYVLNNRSRINPKGAGDVRQEQ
ncbi:MAG: toprim domain-containing protein [Deltaproteobacteria bacterium]|nr:toprim domain-containing protein [Deltaproteobacteria bacterium]